MVRPYSRSLKSAGHTHRAAYHSQAKAEKERANGGDAVSIDFAKPETLRPAFAGIDAVFLLGSGGRGQVEAEVNVADEAKAAGVKRVVKLSVFGAAGEQFAFAKIHRAAERAVEASGLAWTFLRANGFMQNFVNHMGASITTQNAIYQPSGDATISHIDVRDIARVAVRVLTSAGHDGQAYELSGPAALSYHEAAATLSRVTSRPITYVAVSDAAARAGMLAAGMPDFYADYVLDLNRYYRSGAGSQVTSAVKQITGREPTSFEEFSRDHAEAFGAPKATT